MRNNVSNHHQTISESGFRISDLVRGPGALAKQDSDPISQNPKSEFRIPNSGFTVIELLVVVTIIAVLMTLVVQVVGQFLTMARDAATKSTIAKTQGLIDSRAQAFSRLIMRKGYLSGSVEMQSVIQDPNYSTLSLAAQKTIATKSLEMKFFPQRVVELGNPVSAAQQYQVNQLYLNLITKYMAVFSLQQPPGQNISNLSQYDWTRDANATLRSSEILYDFLTQSNVLGEAPLSADAFTSAEVKDTDGNGLPEFIDAWGNPLRFYRWPTRLFRSDGVLPNGTLAQITAADITNAKILFSSLPVFSGNLAADLNRDPDDPLRNCVSIPSFEINFNWTPPKTFHTPATYHVHMIVSAGPDGQLGMYEPHELPQNANDTLHYGYLAQPIPGQQDALTDNIVYLNVRAGGK